MGFPPFPNFRINSKHINTCTNCKMSNNIPLNSIMFSTSAQCFSYHRCAHRCVHRTSIVFVYEEDGALRTWLPAIPCKHHNKMRFIQQSSCTQFRLAAPGPSCFANDCDVVELHVRSPCLAVVHCIHACLLIHPTHNKHQIPFDRIVTA